MPIVIRLGEWRRAWHVLVLLLVVGLGLPAHPIVAAPVLTANDHDINWGALERHFAQNKQVESPMAINPTDALNGISGAIDFVNEPDCTNALSGGSVCYPGQTTATVSAYTTNDGGNSWNKQLLDFSSIGRLANADPSVAFGPKPDGHGGFSYAHGARAYFSAMAFPYGNVSPSAEPVVVTTTSDDGGITWLAPTLASGQTSGPAQFNDKPSLWADNNPASPEFGTVYLTWALFTGRGSAGTTFFCGTCPVRILVAHSTDGGQSWTTPVVLSPSADSGAVGYQERPAIQTDREGRVIVAWEEHDGATVAQTSMVARISSDGGQHFGPLLVLGPAFDMDQLPGTSFPNFNQVVLGADQTTDALYAAWTNYHSINSAAGHGSITVLRSTDHGQTWTPASTIDMPGRTPFHPSLAVARSGAAPAAGATAGSVVIGFTALTDVPFSTPPVTGAVNYLPYVVTSNDGGASWSSPLLPSGAGPSDPAASAGFLNDFGSEFVGDYSSLSAAPDGKTFAYSYSSTQEGTGCPAVDAYRTGQGPLPNIYTQCPASFGNVDIHVTVINTAA